MKIKFKRITAGRYALMVEGEKLANVYRTNAGPWTLQWSDTNHPTDSFESLKHVREWANYRFEDKPIEVISFASQTDFDKALAEWEASQANASNPFLDEIAKAKESKA